MFLIATTSLCAEFSFLWLASLFAPASLAACTIAHQAFSCTSFYSNTFPRSLTLFLLFAMLHLRPRQACRHCLKENVERASARKSANDFGKSSEQGWRRQSRKELTAESIVFSTCCSLAGDISVKAFLAQGLFKTWPSCLVSFVVWHEGLS